METSRVWDVPRMIERFRNLRHKGNMIGVANAKKATLTSLGCGDKITMYVIVEDGIIKEAKFSALSGVTCAVVADLLLDRVLGNNFTVDEVKSVNIDRFLEEVGMDLMPTKKKSAKLPLDTLIKALEQ